MAQVPQAQRQVIGQTVQAKKIATTPGIEAFGGGYGVDRMMNALGNTVGALFDLNDSHDSLEANTKAAELTRLKNNVIHGYNDENGNKVQGYSATTGKAATTEIDTYKNKFKEGFDKLNGELSNDRQKQKFRRYYDEMDLEMDGMMKGHSSRQQLEYDKSNTDAYVQAQRDDAIHNYSMPGKVESSLKKQEQSIVDFGLRNGYEPGSEFIKQKILQAKTMAHAGVIERLLTDDKDQLAKDYLAKVSEEKRDGAGKVTKAREISGDAIANLERMVEAGSLRGESQRISDNIIRTSESIGPALEMARSIEDPKLRDEITQRVKVRFAEANSVKTDQELQNFVSVADYVEKYKTRDGMPVSQWNSLYQKEKDAIDKRILILNSGSLTVNNDKVYSDLMMMASNPITQPKFAKENLFVEARNKLDDPHYNELVATQRGILKKDEAITKKLDMFRTDRQVVIDSLKAVKITQKSDPDVFNDFNRKIALLKERWQISNGKNMPDTEFQKMVDHQLIEGEVPGKYFGTNTKRFFELDEGSKMEVDVENLPKEDVSKIKKALEKNNIPVTDANIIERYYRVRGRDS